MACANTVGRGDVSGARCTWPLDESTMELRAVEFTGSGTGEAPTLPGLQAQIPADEPIASVTADGAHDGRAGRDAIAARCALRSSGRPRRMVGARSQTGSDPRRPALSPPSALARSRMSGGPALSLRPSI
jgi:hypothetical protein